MSGPVALEVSQLTSYSLFHKPWLATDAVTQFVTFSGRSLTILSTTGRSRAMQSGQSWIDEGQRKGRTCAPTRVSVWATA
jgi:hypothetical protein